MNTNTKKTAILRYKIATCKAGEPLTLEGIKGASRAVLMMSKGAKPVSVGLASTGINIYAIAELEAESTEPRNVRILRTGEAIPEGMDYVGTLALPALPALHVFIEPEAP
jgi:hypothetical protein